MELDVYIPSLKVAFEYQGEQHYDPNHVFGDNTMQQRQAIFLYLSTYLSNYLPIRLLAYSLYYYYYAIDRDSAKRTACQQLDITLIEIPFWWDMRWESLASIIHSFRPDLIRSTAIPTHSRNEQTPKYRLH